MSTISKIKKENILHMFFMANTFKSAFDYKIVEIRNSNKYKKPNEEQPIPFCVV